MLHYFGEVQGQPRRVWFVITAVGVVTALLLLVYDHIVQPSKEAIPETTVATKSTD